MINLAVIALSLALSACAGRSEVVRPDSYTQGGNLLHSGVIAYKNDDYHGAIQKFNNALSLYQGLDDIEGSQLSRINLVEALLALSDFAAAEEQLKLLMRQADSGFLDEPLKPRVVLLKVKMLYQQQRYSEALALLEPLLLHVSEPKIADNGQLELLATAARLETLASAGANAKWLNKYRAVLAGEGEERKPKFQIILKRIDAVLAAQRQQYSEALNLLHEALEYYKAQADRRAIASCLEDIADIELARHRPRQARDYLERAMVIRMWLKDHYNIGKLQQKMVLIDRPS